MSTGTLTTWSRSEKMTREQIIKFQVLVYCYMGEIQLTKGELDYLTLLGVEGKILLNDFCRKLVKKGWFTTTSSARNTIDGLQSKQLVNKEGKGKKFVYLSPLLGVQNEGSVLLDIKCFYREL